MSKPKTGTVLVICGMSGDLSRTKLLPALRQLHAFGQLGTIVGIVGTGRGELPRENLLGLFGLVEDEFSSLLDYHQGTSGLKDWGDSRYGEGDRVFFLALPPDN